MTERIPSLKHAREAEQIRRAFERDDFPASWGGGCPACRGTGWLPVVDYGTHCESCRRCPECNRADEFIGDRDITSRAESRGF